MIQEVPNNPFDEVLSVLLLIVLVLVVGYLGSVALDVQIAANEECVRLYGSCTLRG